ncbi:forkhead box protein P3a isoform X1 [Pangasianodon hypophthalmus]|uniref:forkhead box protein P3a isoform X1 n=1 Tax=Pangasianodon hypophthalmus TaxID=310915 RepID=UPI000EFE02B9|nr:forkhead box protein P3a isoform X1 [Pangasianodon hypophthalmus]
MLHNGAGTSGGQDSGSSTKDQKQLHRLVEEPPGFSRSQIKYTAGNSSSRATQCIITKGPSEKNNKQHQQSILQRPSVLRKGNQTLTHALSSQSGVGDSSTELVFKEEMDNKLPVHLPSYDTDYPTRVNASGPSPAQSTTEHHTDPPQIVSENLLFNKGVCTWPGCKEAFKEYNHFLKHLYSEHGPGDKTIEQWRMQKNMVERMESQLVVERQRLQSMYLHLFDANPRLKQSSTPSGSLQSCQSLSILHAQNTTSSDVLPPGYWQIPTTPFIPGIVPSIECYKYTNMRPPFTYASMIRWAILESPEKQLTLNEIYHWFTRKFFYFRHNTATWKNAVRHNLSLHKCFVRVDGGKGSVWTVDEAEFLRRRGQKLHRCTIPKRLSPLNIQDISDKCKM